MSAKNTFKNLVLVLCSLIFALLFFEGLLRLMPDESVEGYMLHNQNFVQHDPILGWVKKPNEEGWLETSEYKVWLETNSEGLRGPLRKKTKPKDVFRIAILGDSFAEGYTVDYQDLFSTVLEKKLNKHRTKKKFEVINFGVGGYSTDQELLIFKRKVKKYRPDLVIVLFYINDVWFNDKSEYFRGLKPFYKLNKDNKLILSGVPISKKNQKAFDNKVQTDKFSIISSGIYYELKKRSRLYSFIFNRAMNIGKLYTVLCKIKIFPPLRGSNGKCGPKKLSSRFLVWKKKMPQTVRKSWAHTKRLFYEFKQEVKLGGGRFIIMYVPQAAELNDKMWAATLRKYNLKKSEWDIHKPRNDFLSSCKEVGIDCWDPFDDLESFVRKNDSSEQSLYYSIDGHWNTKAHSLIEEFLKKKILVKQNLEKKQ